MHMRVGVHQRQGQLHGVAHAHFVDITHVEHLDAHVMHQALLARIHAADADLAQVFGMQCRHVAANLHQFPGAMATQTGHGHAVDIAAGREGGGVEVGMRVEPQHAQPLAAFAAMAGDGADGAYAQTVVAPKHDGQPGGAEFGVGGVVQQLVPAHHLGQMPETIHGRLPGVGRAGQVAAVLDVQAQVGQRAGNTRHPQRLRAHARAQRPGTNVGRCPDQAHACGSDRHGHRNGVDHQAATISATAACTGRAGWTRLAACGMGRTRLNRSFGLASSGISASCCPTPRRIAHSRI